MAWTPRGHSGDARCPAAPDPVASSEFRSVMGEFVSGVTVVTAMVDGRPVGVSANAFTSVSLNPPLVLLCAGKGSETWPFIRRAGAMAVNVLAHDQEDLCKRFATRGVDRFADVVFAAGVTGAPILTGAVVAVVEATIVEEIDAGDHVVLLCRVVSLRRLREEAPLVFHRGRYGSVTPAPGWPLASPQ